MSSVDKLINFWKMNNSDEEDEEYDSADGYSEEEYTESPSPRKVRAKEATEEAADDKPVRKPLPKANPRPVMSQKKSVNGGSNMEVCVCKPTAFDDAKQITDALIAGRSVVLNLEGLDIALARRIFDFAMGSCYALNGRLEAISNYVMVITPESVYISGDTTADTGVLDRALTEG